jgi:hypothetical protein
MVKVKQVFWKEVINETKIWNRNELDHDEDVSIVALTEEQRRSKREKEMGSYGCDDLGGDKWVKDDKLIERDAQIVLG